MFDITMCCLDVAISSWMAYGASEKWEERKKKSPASWLKCLVWLVFVEQAVQSISFFIFLFWFQNQCGQQSPSWLIRDLKIYIKKRKEALISFQSKDYKNYSTVQKAWALLISSSIHPVLGHRRAGAYPSCHKARGHDQSNLKILFLIIVNDVWRRSG